jgi:hypothetical protein
MRTQSSRDVLEAQAEMEDAQVGLDSLVGVRFFTSGGSPVGSTQYMELRYASAPSHNYRKIETSSGETWLSPMGQILEPGELPWL